MNDHEKQKFRSQIGIDATVQRTKEASEIGDRGNQMLIEIGVRMNPKPENLDYLGSAAFHVYKNETLGQVYFVEQAGMTLGKIPESLAQMATKSFIGSIMERFGKKRPKLRSGF